ncbi:MAG: hypothetical protein WB699_04125 [Bacteroidota bacterium]
MNITVENWKDIEREIKESGVQETIYDERGYLKTIISKNGTRYDLPVEVIAQLVDSGAVKFTLGRRTLNR